MTVPWRWTWWLLALLAAAPAAFAATSAEDTAFKSASTALTETIWDKAEAEFDGFVHTFTNSARLPQAVLFQAEARFKQGKFTGVIELLSSWQSKAGKLGDEYLFWTGEAYLQKGDFRAADGTFLQLSANYPASPRRLEAAVEQAGARAQLQQWPQVTELLEQTNGVFQSSVLKGMVNDQVVNGYLLLAKAHLLQSHGAAASAVLDRLTKIPLSATNDWQRLNLMCRAQISEGHLEPALGTATNLLNVAVGTGQAKLKADSLALQAGVLERLNRLPEAIAMYTQNLLPGTPPERHREALLKVVELSLKQNTISEAAHTLEQYLTQFTNAPAEDLAWLTLGELRLRQCASANQTQFASFSRTNAVAETNCLDQALTALLTFDTRFPQSSFLGRSQLDLGWCFWLGGRTNESQAAFQAAIDHLPPSVDQAIAYFKLADVQFRQTNYLGAISNYSAILDKFGKVPEVETNLFETTLYQIVRAGLAQGDLTAATNAVARILTSYPDGFYADRAVLLTGQAVGGKDPALARSMFSNLAHRAPAFQLLPQLELAVARTYEEEDRWPDALAHYNDWLGSFTNHPLQPQAEYLRAWATWKANHEPEALTQFTNFLARFQTNEFAPLAQWWVADYYRLQGDFEEAERNYKRCFQNTNWPPSSTLAYQARLMAGRCAVVRAGWLDAKNDYFLPLMNDPTCPPDLKAQAWFAFGNASMSLVSSDSTNKAPDYREAIDAFDKIPLLFPTNPIVVAALGEKACCLLQSSQTSQHLESVSNAFLKVIESPLADVRARSIAKVGLAVTLEKLAQQSTNGSRALLLLAARDHYLDVLNGRILKEGERPDPFWTKEAGLKVSRLLGDTLKEWSQAVKTLEQLQKDFPVLHLEEKIKSLKAQEQQARQNP